MKVNQIDVISFYPLILPKGKQFALFGSLHVYLPEFDIDLRGIKVTNDGKRTTFIMPFKHYVDEKTGKKKTYPILCFSNRENYADLKKLIEEEGKNYLFENAAEILKEFQKLNVKRCTRIKNVN